MKNKQLSNGIKEEKNESEISRPESGFFISESAYFVEDPQKNNILSEENMTNTFFIMLGSRRKNIIVILSAFILLIIAIGSFSIFEAGLKKPEPEKTEVVSEFEKTKAKIDKSIKIYLQNSEKISKVTEKIQPIVVFYEDHISSAINNKGTNLALNLIPGKAQSSIKAIN